jgi:hypothetical protein
MTLPSGHEAVPCRQPNLIFKRQLQQRQSGMNPAFGPLSSLCPLQLGAAAGQQAPAASQAAAAALLQQQPYSQSLPSDQYGGAAAVQQQQLASLSGCNRSTFELPASYQPLLLHLLCRGALLQLRQRICLTAETECFGMCCRAYGQQGAADMLAAFSGNAYMEGLLGQQQQQQQQMQAVRQPSSELPDPGEWDPGFR